MPRVQLITTRQAAERLGVAVSTVSRLVTAGRLEPAVRLDNTQMLFDPADIEALRRQRAS